MATYKYDKTTGELTKIAGGTLYADAPVGGILPFGGTSIPDGWLACSGQAISRTKYADLYAVIGTYYGNGDGSTTFNVPDLREATVKGTGLSGKSNAHYSVGGITLGQFVDDQIQGHWHDVVLRQSGGSKVYVADENLDNYNSDNLFGTKTRNVATDPISDGTNGTPRTGTTTEVKAVGVNFIIKAKKVGVPADIIDGVKNSADTTPTLDSTNLVTSGGVYNFNYRAKDTSISSDWLGPNNISTNWDTFTNVGDFARILGKRRSVYINLSLGQVQTAIANGVLPSTITSSPGGILHIVTGNSDNGGRGFAFFWCDNTGEVLTATAGDWTSSNWVWRIPGYGTLTGTATPNTSIVSSGVGPVVEWVRSGDMIIVNLRKISFTTNATAAKTLATGLPECGLKRFEGVICGSGGHCDIYIDPSTTELKIQYGATGSYGPQMAGQIVYIAKS